MKHVTLIIYFLIFNSIILKSNNSILSDGKWIKIGVTESGVYKIDKNFFLDNDLSIENIDPNRIQIFGSGYNGSLPQINYKSNLIQPVELESSFHGNDDNYFDDGEYLYFFLNSSDRVYFDTINNVMSSQKNIYSDTSYYLISYNLNERKKINERILTSSYDSTTSVANNFFHYENDFYSIIQSGREWFGSIFSSGESQNIDLFEIEDDSRIDLEISLISRSTVESSFSIFFNEQLV